MKGKSFKCSVSLQENHLGPLPLLVEAQKPILVLPSKMILAPKETNPHFCSLKWLYFTAADNVLIPLHKLGVTWMFSWLVSPSAGYWETRLRRKPHTIASTVLFSVEVSNSFNPRHTQRERHYLRVISRAGTFLLIIKSHYLLGGGTQATCTYGRDNLWDLVFSFHCGDCWEQYSFKGRQPLSLLNHLPGPNGTF